MADRDLLCVILPVSKKRRLEGAPTEIDVSHAALKRLRSSSMSVPAGRNKQRSQPMRPLVKLRKLSSRGRSTMLPRVLHQEVPISRQSLHGKGKHQQPTMWERPPRPK